MPKLIPRSDSDPESESDSDPESDSESGSDIENEGDSSIPVKKKVKSQASKQSSQEPRKTPRPRAPKQPNMASIPPPGSMVVSFLDFIKEIAELKIEIAVLKAQMGSRPLPPEVNEFKTLAIQIAEKYARTKKRWYLDPAHPDRGLDPANREQDKIVFEQLLLIADKIK